MASELEEDLKAVAADVAAETARLHAIEIEKEVLAPGDPHLVKLATEAREIARRLGPKTQSELALAEEAANVREGDR